jgi:hypothetical protein
LFAEQQGEIKPVLSWSREERTAVPNNFWAKNFFRNARVSAICRKR